MQTHDPEPRDYEAVRAEAESWLRANWDPDLTVAGWWAKLAESGWGFPTWPRGWFGRGLPAELAPAVREAYTAVGAIGPPASLGQLLGGPTLLTHGSESQLRRFLPELAHGREFWCQFFSEPGAGSDLAGLETRAVRDGDEWVLNGQKVWTSGAQYADRGMLVARTDPDVPKHQGLTYFIVDLDQPGVEVRPLHQMNGADGFNEVFFTDARVGNDRIVGEENDGWAVAVTTLMFERFMTAVPSADPGRKRAQLDVRAGDVASGAVRGSREMSAYAGAVDLVTRAARELGVERDPVRRQGLAALAVREEVLRLAALRAADAVRAGRRPGAEGSARKLARSELARTVREVGMGVLGARGMLAGPGTPGEGRIQHLALTSPGTSIAGGTDEIQRNIVGERVLGLPREPRVDRDVPFRELKVGTQRPSEGR
jgi:alkylation response protein AidB-like acyl-CoA dehydrogenase